LDDLIYHRLNGDPMLNDLGLPLALEGEISNRKKMNQYFEITNYGNNVMYFENISFHILSLFLSCASHSLKDRRGKLNKSVVRV